MSMWSISGNNSAMKRDTLPAVLPPSDCLCGPCGVRGDRGEYCNPPAIHPPRWLQSVVQVRTKDVRPQTLAPLLLPMLRQYQDELEAGALLIVDQARSRVRLLPLVKP